MNDDTYAHRIDKLPPGYDHVDDMTCPKCAEYSIYGEYTEDLGNDHPTVHGEFRCVNCNYKFTL